MREDRNAYDWHTESHDVESEGRKDHDHEDGPIAISVPCRIQEFLDDLPQGAVSSLTRALIDGSVAWNNGRERYMRHGRRQRGHQNVALLENFNRIHHLDSLMLDSRV